MANRYILTFELEEIVRVPEEAVEVEVGPLTAPEAQGSQEQKNIDQEIR